MIRALILLYLFTLSLPLNANELILTIPKTGTNLVLKCVHAITGKKLQNHAQACVDTCDFDDTIYWAHSWKCSKDDIQSVHPTSEKIKFCLDHNIKVIIHTRDPRDLVCALSRELNKSTHVEGLKQVIRFPGEALVNIGANTQAYASFTTLTKCYQKYLEWAEHPNVFVTSFENLVGPNGGGSASSQIKEVEKLAAFLGYELSHLEASEIAANLFGGTHTFRRGQSGGWRACFTPEVVELFLEREGALVESGAW